MRPSDIVFDGRALARGEGPPVVVRWLGTAGFELTSGGTTVLFDPYLTRASLLDCVTRDLHPDEAVLRRNVPRADAIVLGHTHFDHALDAPSIARRTGARVFGSRSAANLCRAAGVAASQIEVVEREAGGRSVVREVGPFELEFHPSAHAPLVLGRIPFEGEIADCDVVPRRAEAYRCGAVFGVEVRVAGRRLFHLGSAEVLGAMPRLEVDVALVCLAGWTAAPHFPERMIGKLSPRAVVLSHWDNFLRPLSDGAVPLPAMQMPRFVDRVGKASRDTRVGTLPLLGAMQI